MPTTGPWRRLTPIGPKGQKRLADEMTEPSIETLGRPYEVAAIEQRAGKRVKLTRGAQMHADSGKRQ